MAIRAVIRAESEDPRDVWPTIRIEFGAEQAIEYRLDPNGQEALIEVMRIAAALTRALCKLPFPDDDDEALPF